MWIQTVIEGQRAVTHHIGLLAVSRCRPPAVLFGSLRLPHSDSVFLPSFLSPTSFISLHVLISQAQNFFLLGFRASLHSLFLCPSSGLSPGRFPFSTKTSRLVGLCVCFLQTVVPSVKMNDAALLEVRSSCGGVVSGLNTFSLSSALAHCVSLTMENNDGSNNSEP